MQVLWVLQRNRWTQRCEKLLKDLLGAGDVAQEHLPIVGKEKGCFLVLHAWELTVLFSLPSPFAQAGGVAGASVDLILFPLDTIKTRLQSPQGFNKAGGFRGIYAGVPSTAVGSFPNGKGVDIHTAQKPR